MTSPRVFKVSPHTIRWHCTACRQSAVVPILSGARMTDIEAAILRAHHRRSVECHLHRGMKHVEVTQNGEPWPPLNAIEKRTPKNAPRSSEAAGPCTPS